MNITDTIKLRKDLTKINGKNLLDTQQKMIMWAQHHSRRVHFINDLNKEIKQKLENGELKPEDKSKAYSSAVIKYDSFQPKNLWR